MIVFLIIMTGGTVFSTERVHIGRGEISVINMEDRVVVVEIPVPDDSMTVGGHYNPDGHPHAGPDQKQRHMGDMGNLEADESGRTRYNRLDGYLVLNGPGSIIGRAMIVHAGEDDFVLQPTGNAGVHRTCGVIGISRE